MTEGQGGDDHAERIARLEQLAADVLRRLDRIEHRLIDRIEHKLDRVIWRVAGGSASVALLTSLVVALVAAALR